MDEADYSPQPPLKKRKIGDESKTKLEYDRSKILGRGGFAIVYRGNLDGRPVAVKRLQLVDNGDEREEEGLRKLDHPNVISLLHVKNDENFK